MAEYIYGFAHTMYPEICEAENEIGKAPAADVVEVGHGRWIDRYGGKYDNHLYECSECKGKALYYYAAGQVLSDYCPNCGAKMDGGLNENT